MTEISNAQLLELAQLSNFSYNDIFVQNEFNQLDLPYQHVSTSTPRYFDVPVFDYASVPNRVRACTHHSPSPTPPNGA